MDDSCLHILGEFISQNKSLTKVNIGSNKVTNAGIEILMPYLIGNETLKDLYLSWNKEINDESLPNLLEIVEKSCITMLDLSHTSMSESSIQEVKNICSIPIENREIPVQSTAKSAAKLS